LYCTKPPPRRPIATMAPITPPAIAPAFGAAAWFTVGWSVNGELVDWFLLLSGELVVIAGAADVPGALDGDCEPGWGVVVDGNGEVGWELTGLEVVERGIGVANGEVVVGAAVDGCGLVVVLGDGVDGGLGDIVDGTAVVVGVAVDGGNVGSAVVGGATPLTQRSTTTTVRVPSTKNPVGVCRICGVVSVML
jgi:hypothetical protein